MGAGHPSTARCTPKVALGWEVLPALPYTAMAFVAVRESSIQKEARVAPLDTARGGVIGRLHTMTREGVRTGAFNQGEAEEH